jgi:uncharacterized protein YndB with AHSA1/START domain
VFRAWTDPEAKRRWCVCDDGMVNTEYRIDFRPGGSELNRVVTPEGTVHLFQAHFLDIVPDHRIIYAFDMHVGERRISASLATVQFDPGGRGTRMTFTEQVAFLDGWHDREDRIRGTNEGLDRLELELLDRLRMQ